MENKKYSAILTIVITAITGIFTIFILSKTINEQALQSLFNIGNSNKNTNYDNSKNSINYDNSNKNTNYNIGNRIEENINVIDTILNRQNDSIRHLNETLVEIQKELNELKQKQITNTSKLTVGSTKNVSNVKSDTAASQQSKKEATAPLEDVPNETSKSVSNEKSDASIEEQVKNDTTDN